MGKMHFQILEHGLTNWKTFVDSLLLAAAGWTRSDSVLSFPATPTPTTTSFIPNRREIRGLMIVVRYVGEIARWKKANVCIIQMELRISFEKYLKTSN